MTKKEKRIMTIGELREHLNVYPDNYEIEFCGLDFYRLKQRGPNLVQMEFNQQVYLDENDNVVIENLD